MNTIRRRKRAVILIALIAIGGASAAYAYWTSSGSGSGTASAGTLSALTVNQTASLTAMYPGDSPQTLSGTFDNPNAGPAYVGTVTASIASVAKAGGAPAGTCDATDYTLASSAMTVNAQVAAGNGKGSWSGATIQFNNKAGNQDACKGATVTLAYTIS